MRTLQSTKIAAVFLLAFFFMMACESGDPIAPDMASQNEGTRSLNKGKPIKDTSYDYPMSIDLTFLWVNPKKGFQGGQMKVENGTTFFFDGGSLTPPSGWTDDRIILSMEVDKDPVTNEFLFTFGPSGCQFSPAAEVWFVYEDLGIPTLYYIESNGTYTEQTPEYIDFQGNKMMLKIDHFSRYAIGFDR